VVRIGGFTALYSGKTWRLYFTRAILVTTKQQITILPNQKKNERKKILTLLG
jgi:hypothetical protein